jgi:hypothetical protein
MVINAFSLIFELHSSDCHARRALIKINTNIGVATNFERAGRRPSGRSGTPAAKWIALFLRGKRDSHKVKRLMA